MFIIFSVEIQELYVYVSNIFSIVINFDPNHIYANYTLELPLNLHHFGEGNQL